ncbi:hypothetical protein [Bacteroides intestinalis]|jgi:hypothetical protein|uniref:hypothetical protein n=2 Tax=Bacteroides intestinalis TaxID=329854 RepID=UPI0018A065B4|nr:hypothetical protein [Bacteroides intestinalis]
MKKISCLLLIQLIMGIAYSQQYYTNQSPQKPLILPVGFQKVCMYDEETKSKDMVSMLLIETNNGQWTATIRAFEDSSQDIAVFNIIDCTIDDKKYTFTIENEYGKSQMTLILKKEECSLNIITDWEHNYSLFFTSVGEDPEATLMLKKINDLHFSK